MLTRDRRGLTALDFGAGLAEAAVLGGIVRWI